MKDVVHEILTLGGNPILEKLLPIQLAPSKSLRARCHFSTVPWGKNQGFDVAAFLPTPAP